MTTVLDVLAVIVLAVALWHIVPELWARQQQAEQLDCWNCSWSIRFRNVAPESARYLRTLAEQHAAGHIEDRGNNGMGESWIWEPGDRDTDTNGDAR
ncbi:hypothetical protein [Streptomyces virginiae]|uniref:hypothetical protein n=1 Tax=Streptomyces virginiae TaxID=1961 RepID=UPI00225834BB|nr:hypothetical protein [Streptomyces virginiae]MCX5270970.1 hypothetical protein [Streptomyces virginiae]